MFSQLLDHIFPECSFGIGSKLPTSSGILQVQKSLPYPCIPSADSGPGTWLAIALFSYSGGHCTITVGGTAQLQWGAVHTYSGGQCTFTVEGSAQLQWRALYSYSGGHYKALARTPFQF